MSEDIKPEVLKTTQSLLSKFIKKPPLTDKLLKKPPFRYLHDIITSIINETGFLKGLYTQGEMVVDNNLDKAGKIAYLDKLIATVKLATGSNLTVKSSKIVSGLEVSKTHELLQAIGYALENKIDSSKAVNEILNKGNKKSAKSDVSKSKTKVETPKKNSSKRNSSNSGTPKHVVNVKSENTTPEKIKDSELIENVSKENVQNNSQIPIQNNEETKDVKEEETPLPESSTSETVQIDTELSKEKPSPTQNEKKSPREEKKSSPREEKKKNQENRKSTPREERRSSSRDEKKSSKEDKKTPREEKKTPPDKTKVNGDSSNKTGTDTESIKKTNSGKLGTSPKGDGQKGKTSAGKDKKEEKSKKEPDKRPTSARPGSRKPLKSNGPQTNSQQKENIPMKRPSSSMKRPPTAGPRPPSARPGAPRVKERGEVMAAAETPITTGPVNLIMETAKNDEDEEMVTVEAANVEAQRKQSLPSPGEPEQHGQLVNQILETQKEFEDGIETNLSKKTQIEWEGAKKRGREQMVKEIDKLKDWIQIVTKCAHPLGKLMDFFQEDIEEMQRELQMWKRKSHELKQELEIETEKTHLSIEPLTLQLEELESKIIEESEQVILLKSKILKNDQRITNLLKSNPRGLSGRQSFL